MQKSYLTISVAVIIIGVAFIFYPAAYEVNLAPELVTVWEDMMIAYQTEQGTLFGFETGEQTINDGLSHHVKVWSDEDVSLNTTFILVGEKEYDPLVMQDNPAEAFLPGLGMWNIAIEGTVLEGSEAEINAGLYYLRPLEPERVTYYPYRFFGYGMAAIGAVASIAIYIRSKMIFDSGDLV